MRPHATRFGRVRADKLPLLCCRISPTGSGAALEAPDAGASAIDNVSRWASTEDEEEEKKE